MIIIPQRLFGEPQVRTILRDGNTCILEKQLSQSLFNREGYISNHVISILLVGQQRITTYEDQQITVNGGEILLIPRGLYHITDLVPREGQFHSLLFYFGNDLIQDFLSGTPVQEVKREVVPEYLKLGVVPTIQQFAHSLLQVYRQPGLNNKRFLPIKILELLHLINDLVSEQRFADFLFQLTLPQRRNIGTFLENNFDKPLNIEDYAHLTGRSVSTFRRDFKQQFHTTPKKWLKQKRIERAVHLLNTRSMSVNQLSYAVGYDNVSYFIRAFRKEVGLTPKQYLLRQGRDQV